MEPELTQMPALAPFQSIGMVHTTAHWSIFLGPNFPVPSSKFPILHPSPSPPPIVPPFPPSPIQPTFFPSVFPLAKRPQESRLKPGVTSYTTKHSTTKPWIRAHHISSQNPGNSFLIFLLSLFLRRKDRTHTSPGSGGWIAMARFRNSHHYSHTIFYHLPGHRLSWCA